MAPRKLPNTLYNCCLKSCVQIINLTAYNVSKCSEDYTECEKNAVSIKRYLDERIPARVFEDLCILRSKYGYEGHLAIQFMLITHSSLTVLKKSNIDDSFTPEFWIKTLPNYTKLLVLDLKFLCTDEILKVISNHCPLLQDVNIVSKISIRKSPINAYVLVRNVSNDGLQHIAKLKKLRILSMDPPRHDTNGRSGRNVTPNGIVTLISQLPVLEELKIETCDVGATIIGCRMDIGTLSLTTINYHFATADGIKKLIEMCPQLKALSCTHLNVKDKDQILDSLSFCKQTFTKLHLAYVDYSYSLKTLLHFKGENLVDVALSNVESLDPDAIEFIGYSCPYLESLRVIYYTTVFKRRRYTDHQIFVRLKRLTIESELPNISEMLYYFFYATKSITELNIKCKNKSNIDELMGRVLRNRLLINLEQLHLDCSLELSPNVVKEIIVSCNNLVTLRLLLTPEMNDLHEFIKVNNYDMSLLGF